MQQRLTTHQTRLFGPRPAVWGILLCSVLALGWFCLHKAQAAFVQDARFVHSVAPHSSQSCNFCHQGTSAVPQRPGHATCVNCHADQFADSGSPLCGICHNTPATAAVKPFPRLRSFGVSFAHARHRRANCASCHRTQGANQSVPASYNAHTACFQCHSPQTGNSCATCHAPGRFSRPAIPGNGAARLGFSHARHSTAQVSCSACHTVRAGAPRGQQVTLPPARMHQRAPQAQSCGSCHNNQRAFGGYDFADCKRCHTESFGFIRR